VFLIPIIKYYVLQVGAHLNVGMPDNPLTAIAVAGLTDMIKCLLEAGANIIDGSCRKKELKVMNPEKGSKRL
jgi:ankyrin repeat protein